MSDEYEKMGFFDQLKRGLEDSIAYSRGELSLKTTELPAPPPKATPKAVASLRKNLKMSQAVFAATLNVSFKTVQAWEQGLREPSDVALRMLQVLRDQPEVVNGIFNGSIANHDHRPNGHHRAGRVHFARHRSGKRRQARTT